LAARCRRGLVNTLTLVLPQNAGAGPEAYYPTLSEPGLKTILKKSSFRNFPNYET